jgi:hypothetical protein
MDRYAIRGLVKCLSLSKFLNGIGMQIFFFWGGSHLPISSKINFKNKDLEAQGRHMPTSLNFFEGMGMQRGDMYIFSSSHFL